MPTIVVDNYVRFKNLFSSFGRKQNQIYRELNALGCAHIRQRALPTGAIVTLGYKDSNSKFSNISCLLNPDLTTEHKSTDINKHSLTNHISTIQKVFTDKKGNATKVKTKSRTQSFDGKVIKTQETETNASKVISNKKYSRHGFASLNLIPYTSEKKTLRVTEKVVPQGTYALLEHIDGSKTYIKEVNGQIYTFATT